MELILKKNLKNTFACDASVDSTFVNATTSVMIFFPAFMFHYIGIRTDLYSSVYIMTRIIDYLESIRVT
jgi:hypothetical protein